jgi:membrane AbrB-like protein
VLIVLPLAILGGWLGIRLSIPAGPLLGAIVVVGLYQLGSSAPASRQLPGWLSLIVYSLLGAEIGLTVTRDTLLSLRDAYFPITVLAVGIFALSILGAWVVSRISNVDLVSALLSGSPSGISGIAAMGRRQGQTSLRSSRYHDGRPGNVQGRRARHARGQARW